MTHEEHAKAGNIYVIGVDRMCFWANAKTLDPYSCGCYDPWCSTDPPTKNTMHVNEWSRRHVGMMMKK